jgi:hypothetical protein
MKRVCQVPTRLNILGKCGDLVQFGRVSFVNVKTIVSMAQFTKGILDLMPTQLASGEIAEEVLYNDDGRRLSDSKQLYHDQVIVVKYVASNSDSATDEPDTPIVAKKLRVGGNDDDDDDDDGDGDVDDKLTAAASTKKASAPSTRDDVRIEAELDALLGPASASGRAKKSLGKSRDLAARSREFLERSFHELAEPSTSGTGHARSLGAAVVSVQLDELRALVDAYAHPLLEIGDAVPLRGVLRLDASSALELADTPASVASAADVGNVRLVVAFALPPTYPKQVCIARAVCA